MKILLIDGSAVCYTMMHALPDLSHEELPTSIIYGFLTQLVHYQKMYCADRVVFAWDGLGSKRTEIFPEYKAKRKALDKKQLEEATPKERERAILIKRQFGIIREEVLPNLGFVNNFYQDGYEGDDIVASICGSNKQHKIVIVANDRDIFQLITGNHTMFYMKDRTMITEDKILQQYAIPACRFGEMKSIAGCLSDEVPGVKGIGEKTAVQYMYGDLKRTSKAYQKIISGEKVIEFTKRLVVLPFEGTNTFTIQKDNCTINKFRRLLRIYGFETMREEGYIMDIRRCFCDQTCI